MNNKNFPGLGNIRTFDAAQLPMFPLDPWGAEHVVAVFDHPHAGIARAMVGPMVLGQPLDIAENSLHCLAVTDDGEFAARIQLHGNGIHHLDSLWSHVAHGLDAARRTSYAAGIDSPIAAKDCFKSWCNSSSWVAQLPHGDPLGVPGRALSKLMAYLEVGTVWPSDEVQIQLEKQALVEMAKQVDSASKLVLSALQPDLFDIFRARLRMNVPMACQLLALAKKHGSAAVIYTLQALRTESLGVLDMIRCGQPEDAALQIRDALFNGNSLPDAMQKIGIEKATHRQSLTKPKPQNHDAGTEDAIAFSERALSGRDWLFSMRLTQHLPLHDKADWEAFGGLVERLLSVNLLHGSVAAILLQWCSRPGWKDSDSRLAGMVEQAQTLVTAAKGLADFDLPLEVAVTHLIGFVTDGGKAGLRAAEYRHMSLAPENLAQLVMPVAQISGQSMSVLLKDIFESQPTLLADSQMPEFTHIKPLNSIDLAMAHGLVCQNCLTHLETILHYLISGVGLYGVHSMSGVMGTIALSLDCTGMQPKVDVQEVAGIGNVPAGNDLRRVAHTFSNAWSAAPQVSQWIKFDAQCAAWRKRCGPL